MAMTKCKECGAQISTTAESCPHCGAKQKKTRLGMKLSRPQEGFGEPVREHDMPQSSRMSPPRRLPRIRLGP